MHALIIFAKLPINMGTALKPLTKWLTMPQSAQNPCVLNCSRAVRMKLPDQ